MSYKFCRWIWFLGRVYSMRGFTSIAPSTNCHCVMAVRVKTEYRNVAQHNVTQMRPGMNASVLLRHSHVVSRVRIRERNRGSLLVQWSSKDYLSSYRHIKKYCLSKSFNFGTLFSYPGNKISHYFHTTLSCRENHFKLKKKKKTTYFTGV